MLFYIIVAVVSLLIGLSKGGLGAALVVLVTPLLSQVMSVADAVSLSLPMLLIADVFALWLFWNKWDMYYIKLMIVPAILGIIVGTFMLANLPDLALRRILGVFTLTFVGYRMLSAQLTQLHFETRPWHGVLAGAASGLGSALANTGAPPFTAYMLLLKLPPLTFVGTTTLFFAIVNLIKLPGLIAADLFDLKDVIDTAWALPIIPAGVFLGRWLIHRINPHLFERFMLFVLLIAAGVLLFITPAAR